MRELLILLGFVVLLAPGARAQILTYKKPDPSVPPMGVDLKRTVVYIESECKHGEVFVNSKATGFLVGYPDSRLPNTTFFSYLVTNRHVAECWDEDNRPMPIKSAVLQINSKDGTSSQRFALDTKAWHFPSDDSVDLAATSVTLPDTLDIKYISVADFATKDFLHANVIAEGSPIILAGCFVQLEGVHRFEPIVRQGILSMIPDEPVMTTARKLGTVYLGDVHIFGGNSGSPVMVTDGPLNMSGYHLLGVVSGYYYETEDFKLEIATIIQGKAQANSGVAMIVPADLVKDLLDSPDFKNGRDIYFSQPSHAARPAAQK